LSCFEKAGAGAPTTPARLAWRKGLIHYLRDDLEAALEAYGRGVDDAAAEPGEMALLLAWMASAYWLQGDTTTCRRLAEESFELAAAGKDNKALAAAHTALAMLAALDGDRRGNDAHYLLALRAAEEAHDVLQIVRIRTNRASHFIEEGAYEEGLRELDVAVRMAELTSFTSFLDLSLLNRGQARFHLGQLDEALADYEASRARCLQIGSDGVAYPLGGIGDVYRERGNLAQARAVELARSRRDRAGLAEALALACLSSERPRARMEELREAASIWASIGDRLGEARAAIALDWLQPGSSSTADRVRAERLLASRGLRYSGGNLAAGLLALVTRGESRSVRVLSLGGFSVVRGGEVVKTSEWQSRRARELLKMLVARRGRPVPRTALMEALWPDEAEERLGNRLSVALTTVRSILDPEKRNPPDEFIRADRDAVTLNIEALDVDLERFMASAVAGLSRTRSADASGPDLLLEAAEAIYSGEFLEENPYDDWAASAREEARATYIAVARTLADLCVARGEPDAAARYLLRVLETDRYDEDAHLKLVKTMADAGRHGEAHRHYLGYRRAMEQLGVEPVEFPGSAALTAP
jgi:DNA-binding SARP family transcriptional activator